MFTVNENFQTPPIVAGLMAHMASGIKIPITRSLDSLNVLEPTPGTGMLVEALKKKLPWKVHYPEGDFWESLLNRYVSKFDVVVMNPPFNPVSEMVRFVTRAMELSDNVIALLPWTYVINSERRLIQMEEFGLVSVTNIPRKTFPGCRVQTAIFELKKGHGGHTEFKRFSW